MPYMRETIIAGNVIEVREYYTARYNQKGGKRAPHKDETGLAQQIVNHRNAERKLRGLLNENFKTDDWFISLRYQKGYKVSREECKKDAVRFVRLLRKIYKQAGIELKYIYVIENLKRACHIHMVLPTTPAIKASEIRAIWSAVSRKTKSVYFNPTHPGDFAAGLASYMLKEYDPKKEEYRKAAGESKFYASKNLRKPDVVKEIMKRTKIPKEPTVKKGYVLLTDSIYAGVCAFTGLEYRTYRMLRADVPQKKSPKKYKKRKKQE